MDPEIPPQSQSDDVDRRYGPTTARVFRRRRGPAVVVAEVVEIVCTVVIVSGMGSSDLVATPFTMVVLLDHRKEAFQNHKRQPTCPGRTIDRCTGVLDEARLDQRETW